MLGQVANEVECPIGQLLVVRGEPLRDQLNYFERGYVGVVVRFGSGQVRDYLDDLEGDALGGLLEVLGELCQPVNSDKV